MARHMLMALQNATPGNEDAFVEWFEQQHIPDLLQVDGIVAGQLHELNDRQLATMATPHKFVCIYEIETDDLDRSIDDLIARSNTPAMPHSPTLDYSSIHALYFTPVTKRVARDD